MPSRLPDAPIVPYQLAKEADQAQNAYRENIARWMTELVQVAETRLHSLEITTQIKAYPVQLVPATVTELTSTGSNILFRPGQGKSAFAVNATNATATNGCPVYGDGSAWRRYDGSAI